MQIDKTGLRQQTGLMSNTTINIVPVFATANDEFYRSVRHLSVPIPETMTHVPDYPAKLRIYKIAASPYWQMRCYFKGKAYTKTTETTSKRTALVKARDFFHSKVAELYGVTVQLEQDREVVFADLVAPMLAMQQGRVDRGELARSLSDLLQLVENFTTRGLSVEFVNEGKTFKGGRGQVTAHNLHPMPCRSQRQQWAFWHWLDT